MKRFFLAIIAMCLIAAVHTSAQESSFQQNNNVVSLGVGFGGTLYSGYHYTGSSINRMPVFTLGYERCILGELFNEQSALGIGGLFGYTSAKYDYSGWGWTSTDIMAGVRGAFHYAFIDYLDTYAGVMFGYNYNTWKWRGEGYTHTSGSGSSGLTYSVFAGARYYFADAIGVFAEVGYGYSMLSAGISLKF
jgi:hypothetical protein